MITSADMMRIDKRRARGEVVAGLMGRAPRNQAGKKKGGTDGGKGDQDGE